MSDYTIFSSSNRTDNKSKMFAELCRETLENQGLNAKVCSLQQLPDDLSSVAMYNFDDSPIAEIVEKYLTPVDKLIFVIPEYNGSFPGILKLFIDAVHPSNFKNKKAALIGISSGRSGNIRGMDHLTNILNYLKVDVYHHKMPIASIDSLINNGIVTDKIIINRVNELMEHFKNY